MTTARTIIRKSLQKIGVLFKTEEPSADEANDALFSLNAMVSSWSNKSMLIYARVRETFTLQAGVGTYTIGPGGTFNTIRPIEIISAYSSSGTIDYPIELISDEEYANIGYKSLQAPWPEFMNYSNGYPLGTFYFVNIPSGNFPFTLYSEKELSQFSTLDADVELPPGWEQALIYNLAIMLAPEYGQQIDQTLVAIAKDALTSIKTAIIRNRDMDFPYDIDNTQNIYSGWFYR